MIGTTPTAVSATKTIKVFAPNVNKFEPVIGHVLPNGSMMQLLADVLPGKGIKWTASVSLPPPFSTPPLAGGTFQFVQLVTSNRTQATSLIARSVAYSKNGLTVLDTSYPYDGPWGTGSLEKSSGDSPGQGLDPGNVVATVSDQFTTYLYFTPPGGIAVPVKSLPWSWGGTLYFNGVDYIVSATSQSAGASTDVATFTLWTGNIVGGTWQ